MLASDDVFDVIDEEWLCVLRKAAVFAAVIGTFTGGFAGAARPSGSMAFGQEPASFRLQNCNEFSDADHCLILVALLRG
jgi:hypothetical protein